MHENFAVHSKGLGWGRRVVAPPRTRSEAHSVHLEAPIELGGTETGVEIKEVGAAYDISAKGAVVLPYAPIGNQSALGLPASPPRV